MAGIRMGLVYALAGFLSLATITVGATTDVQSSLIRLAEEDVTVRRAALMDLARTGDPRLESVFEAFRVESLYVWQGQVVLCNGFTKGPDQADVAPLSDAVTRERLLKDAVPVSVPATELKVISAGRVDRQLAQVAKQILKLKSPDVSERLSGVKKCGDPPVIADAVPVLEELAANDPDSKIQTMAKESILLIRFESASGANDTEARIKTVQALGAIHSLRAQARLEDASRVAAKATDASSVALYQAYGGAIKEIAAHQRLVERIGNLFQGLSLGSVLVLIALGLAITFGLMGVINMAHGELMMIGAYATYQTQLFFSGLIEKGHLSPAAYDWYYIAALPISFLVAAFVGLLMEVLVVRHLYRRPVESLLATWGLGLILIQMIRIHYGDNVGVNAPSWARGGVEVMQDVIVPYGRLFIIGLCVVSVGLIYMLMNKTPVGLKMRATMQNREMANGLGVNTVWVDRITFAFGAGLAGIAGCAWTLIGGVTPDMGQKNFIVDAFLVVVTGGVGELAGVISSGLGLGLITKWIEPLTIRDVVIGAIWAKVILLVLIMAFIQFKPSGLFAPKGRLADV